MITGIIYKYTSPSNKIYVGKTCNVIYGQVVLPNEPTVTGYVGANQCGCPRVITSGTAPAA